MNSLLVFTAAVVVALVLGRQEARHELSLRLRAHRAGLVPPVQTTSVPRLEGLLTLVLGLTLLLAGGGAALKLTGWAQGFETEFLRDACALVLAAGVALIALGISAVRRSEHW